MTTTNTPADKAEKILDQIVKAKGGSRRSGQVQMARAVAESLSTGKPLMVQGGTGIGKALDVDTLIPTLEGWVRMGDLEAGKHHPFDEHGKPCNITEAFKVRRNRTCYKVTFLGGSWIIADAEHLWTTITNYASRAAFLAGETNPWARATTQTTEELLENLYVRKRYNHRIPAAGAMQTPKKRLPIDPYELGYWLGSSERGFETRGSVAKSALPAEPLKHFVLSPGAKTSTEVEPKPATEKKLRALGLTVSDRFIPEEYQFASVDQRRALLSGILDAKGQPRLAPRTHVAQVTLYKTQVQLIDDVHALVSSLGIQASVRDRDNLNVTYRQLTFTPREQLFRVPGKAAAAGDFEAEGQKRVNYRSIINIEKVPSRPVRCIAVDSESHLYLAGRDFIPTHNSMAYLAGALASGKKTAVAPHTKALQDQLADDGDLMAEAFADYDFEAEDAILSVAPSYAVIKGRSSYYCGNRVASGAAEDENQGALPLDASGEAPAPSSDLAKEVLELMEWAKTTQTGDRADAPPVSYKAWSMVSGSVEDCSSNGCRKKPDLCFAELAHERAKEANIVVVNQAYLAASMKIEWVDLGCDAVVVDECHEFPSVIADAFGAILKRRRVEQTVKRVTNMLTGIGTIDDAQAESWNKDADQRLGQLEAHLAKMSKFGQDRSIVETPAVKQDLKGLRDLITPMRRKVAAAVESADEEKTKATRRSLHQALGNLIDDLQLLERGSDDFQVVWADREDRVPVLKCARFDVSETISNELIDRITEGSVVMTSATLTVGGKFDHPAQQMGFTVDAKTYPWDGKIVESPFDYPAQRRIWVPEGMPAPVNSPEGKAAYAEAVADVAAKVAQAAGGRTLVLCTSWGSVQAISEQLRSDLAGTGITVLAQAAGDAPRQVAAEFAAAEKAVLVGTRTFWTGVSFEGDACISVIVEKTPFPVPSDPIIASRSEKVDNQEGKGKGFIKVSLAEAILTIVQGAGRLIRTVNDRGVVVLCDPRLNPRSPHSKRYARSVKDSLPPFPWTLSEDEALAFLRSVAADADAKGKSGVAVEVEEAAEDVTDVVEAPVPA